MGGDGSVNLLVGIFSQCICISNYHINFKYITVLFFMLYLNKDGGKMTKF